MHIVLCQEANNSFDFTDPCVRTSWSALLPAILAFAFAFFSLPISYQIPSFISSHISPFLTLQEAEALQAGQKHKHVEAQNGDGDNALDGDLTDPTSISKSDVHDLYSYENNWRILIFAGIGLLQTLAWVTYASYFAASTFNILPGRRPSSYPHHHPLSQNPTAGNTPYIVALHFLTAFAWLYTFIRAFFLDIHARLLSARMHAPPYDFFVLYTFLFIGAILQLGGFIYDHHIVNHDPWHLSLSVLVALCANAGASVVALGAVLTMPIAIPGIGIDRSEIGHSISPEDYTSLFGWITFSWVYPLIRRGRNTTLNERDVWNMSPSMQSRPVFVKFSAIRRSTLIRKLWAANSLDLILDFSLTLVSVLFNYSTPFFLKRILDAIDMKNPTLESTALAYTYAFLAFVCTLLKAQADIQHLWYGRRAATRIRSELMAAIYDKALKRKDFSGVVDKEKEKERERGASGKHRERKGDEGAGESKPGADVGKIVNLMGGDANRISQTVTGMYFLYGAPFEIVIASVFLYQLLGLSAFAGFVVLLAGWPLNSYVARRSIRIQQGLSAARDKRMGVLNELIGAIKMIKFFAWEDQWVDRVTDAREVEIMWMRRARVNSVLFYMLWTCAPVLVSIVSFFVYVVFAGGELGVSIAFTSIALFNMIRAPLNVIPAWIVELLQTNVAMKRIAVFLDEEEVSEQVSSIKNSSATEIATRSSTDSGLQPEQRPERGLGIRHASFKWNSVSDKKWEDSVGDAKGKKSKGRAWSRSSESGESALTVTEARLVADQESDTQEPEDHEFELQDINVMFPEGEITVVTGPTASGKTALLMALLGEMTMLPGSGELVMSKNVKKADEHGLTESISYAAQVPWLRHQSIKDNILFGSRCEEERYRQVVDCCALRPDLEMLEDGDETEIGARGVSLSGGQKARVALARAVYARTKYVLLDDPLSAVDSHTSRFLYERLLLGPLLANRTVILVTHHVDLVLPGAYYIVRMLDGHIDVQGIVKELRERGLLEDIGRDAAVEAQKDEMAINVEEQDVNQEEEDGENKDQDKTKKKPRKLVKDEHRETGGVKWTIYKSYLKASSYWIWGFLFFLVVIAQVLGLAEKVWIMIWGEAYSSADDQVAIALRTPLQSFVTPEFDLGLGIDEAGTLSLQHHIDISRTALRQQHSIFGFLSGYFTRVMASRGRFGIEWPEALQHPLYYVGVYAAIGLASALTSVLSVTAQYTGALRASRTLFKQLLVTVVRATFRFHDTTPQGRMLNRFGKDTETIDSSLVGSLQSVNSSLASFFASLITVAFVFPAFFFPAIFIGFGYYQLAIGYLNTGRDLRRMESNTRSPIYSDFGELLEGIVTVRAFSAEWRFLDNLHQKIDVTTKMWYSFWMTNRWLLLNFDSLGAVAVFITMLFSIATMSNGAGMAGLTITSAMGFTTSVYWACRFWTALELDLNSVERVVEYLDLPQEPPAVIESNRVSAYWPSNSSNSSLVSVEKLVVKYSPELPAVLHEVSFTLKAGERVGLLGRTGSGKSTLAMSILRFVDPTSGRIIIDGVDISTIGIHDLRSRLTFIPQDAILFSGTLRDNLDPFAEHTDSECLDVLRRVQMITDTPMQRSPSSSRTASVRGVEQETASLSTMTDFESKSSVSLDSQVSAGGTNFSQGQRQLIAMARALLRRSSIIVLDEATSSIDFATDAKIQTTIREEFTESLLLTVAHRLRTVIDYDRLIVLDKGQIVEFDTPWKLIEKKDGIFRHMCLKSGSFGELEAAARSKSEQD